MSKTSQQRVCVCLCLYVCSMAITGVWFAAVTFYAYTLLDNNVSGRPLPEGMGYIKAGCVQFVTTLRHASHYPYLIRFLIALCLVSHSILRIKASSAIC